ncbi:hypothetical protein [Mycobacterium sp. NPDC004974]
MTYPPQWNPPPGDPFENYQSPQTPSPGGYYQPIPGWSGYGEAPPADQPPKRSRTPLIVGTVAGVVAITLLVGLALWGFNSRGNDTAGIATTTSAAATDEPTGTTTAPSSTTSSSSAAPAAPPAAPAACEGRVPTATPQTPAGWNPVASPRGLNYAVPGNWEVNACTDMVGWEKPCSDGPFGYCPIRTMSGSTSIPNEQCPKGSRGVTGVPGAKNTPDINEAVQGEAKLVADIYTSKNGVVPSVSLSPPRNFTVGGTPAVQIVATVTGIEGDNCTGTSALHSMVATTVPGQPGSVLFVVSLEQGYPGAPDPGLIDQLVGTLNRAS